MEPTTFGAMLKRYRTASGLTQEALAERANLSARAISDLERGLSRVPRYDTLDLLARAMNLSDEQRTTLLVAARPSLAEENPKSTPSQVLPLVFTALLGREQEVTQALNFIREHGVRLLTLTGPGGVGKTQFALEIAHTLRDSFADVLTWIDLTNLRDPTLVPQTVAQVLKLREQADQSFSEQVRTFLQDKQCLLFLDNFEHVLSAADFVSDLLIHCSRLQVVVTSRVPLHLRAEQQLVLAPLSQAASVALFHERARRVQPDLDDTLPTVIAICEQVDRLPLAIELAAAHVKELSLPLLLARLSNRLRFLKGGIRDLPKRQQTMREAIAWSYDLLSLAERHWFRALGVFIGGCTLSAAEAVCRTEESNASDEGLSIIAALVDANLVQVNTIGEESITRYSMLEVIREYALEQLQVMGEADFHQGRHAEYYADLVEEAERIGPDQKTREALLNQESANGRAALHWTYEHDKMMLGLRLATWFGFFWMKRGQMSEGNVWLERMLARDEVMVERAAPLAIRGKALYFASNLSMQLGRAERARALALNALTLAEQAGEQSDIGNALAMLGAIALATGSGDEAAIFFTKSYAAAKRAEDVAPMGRALINLAELARKRGEFARATELLEEALAVVRSIDMPWGIANILTLMGHLARQQQDYERAKRCYREGLLLYQQLDNKTYTAWCLEGIAALALAEESYERTGKLCAVAAALRVAAGTPLPPIEQEDVNKVVSIAREQLDEKTFIAQWEAGLVMTQDEAVSYALIGLSSGTT